ncbi:multidrug resistance-associated protein 4-like [Stylophora pistillata]|uniref:multidrug resistance-associated protein 4-like n=1 Tax=Stylophora pistillata TaxID=50429 RepID=UPI000C03ABD5|nr:multidrug resistance-associated protein 4-like [Stylophora pistillata]
MTYTKLDSEPGYQVERRPPEHWPCEGNIIFRNVSMTYYPGGPQALKNINLDIIGGSNIGVAGRTGAGKSSSVAALLRMPDPGGEILVDGIQIKNINLRAAGGCISSPSQIPKNKIVILDEPTAHVDPGTEETMYGRAVREKLRDSTVITIAHRLNTIRHCDKVLVFKEGEVVESGTFDLTRED